MRLRVHVVRLHQQRQDGRSPDTRHRPAPSHRCRRSCAGACRCWRGRGLQTRAVLGLDQVGQVGVVVAGSIGIGIKPIGIACGPAVGRDIAVEGADVDAARRLDARVRCR